MEKAELKQETIITLNKLSDFLEETTDTEKLLTLTRLFQAILQEDEYDLLDAWETFTGNNIRGEAIQDHRDDTGCRCGQ